LCACASYAAGSGQVLRFTDPRRFGSQLWQPRGETHELLAGLGPEPLSVDFDGDLLWTRSRGRKAAVKLFLMDQAIVVGQAEIEHDGGVFHGREDVKGVADRTHRIGGEAALGETLLEEGHKLWVVLDEKHPHWCRASAPSTPDADHSMSTEKPARQVHVIGRR